MKDNSKQDVDSEALEQKIENANKKMKIWTMFFFGLFLQTIQMWTWFFNPDLENLANIWNYGVFIFIGIWFLIGFLGYKIYKLKMKSVEKTHTHKYNKSLHCEICGKYWELRTCLHCNSENIVYLRKTEDFEYFKRNVNVIECKACGKTVEIDSFSSARIKGVKYR